MRDMLERALPDALDAGMTPTEFWSATLREIRQILESFQRRKRAELQQQAIMDYRHAYLVANVFAGKSLQLHEVYPGLFEEPDRQQDWRIAKERLLRYADAHNRKRAVKKE